LIDGFYTDAGNLNHGFLRHRDGAITTFDVPGAGTGAYQGTLGENINEFGLIDGYYIDTSNVSHGFLRALDGAITTFDAPDAGKGAYQGTSVGPVNSLGVVTGAYTDSNNLNHGYLRTPACDEPWNLLKSNQFRMRL